jgi:hypothetical protein
MLTPSVSAQMWQRAGLFEDPFTSPATPPSATFKWANRINRPSRYLTFRSTRVRIGTILFMLGLFIFLGGWIEEPSHIKVSTYLLVESPHRYSYLDLEHTDP